VPKRATPEDRLIDLFDSVDVERAEILVGLAKTLLKRKKKVFHWVLEQQDKAIDAEEAKAARVGDSEFS
jgi:hypothetical protein